MIDLEVQRLEAGDRADLAARVRWIARDVGDGAGYDVASFELDGAARHIEVKTTRGGASTPFYLSAGELAFATAHPRTACIYRVYDIGGAPQVYEIRPPYESELTLEPITYRARR